MATYPLFLELQDRSCLVIGGGQVAFRKVLALASCGARVSVVSPTLAAGLKRVVRQGKVRWKRHPFRLSDLKGIQLLIAATDDSSVNRLAAHAARRRGIWINVVDRPELCSFIVPAVVRRGKLVLAISTGGVSPALAKWIRKDLQARYGREFEWLVSRIGRVRGDIKRSVPSVAQRRRVFEKALRAYFQTLEKASH